MDLTYGERYEEFRRELREFLTGWPLCGAEAALPATEQERMFLERGIAAGYVYRTIPAEYGGAGRGSHPPLDPIIPEEYLRTRAPGKRPHQGPCPPRPPPL